MDTITLAGLAAELGIEAPSSTYGTAADFFASYDHTLQHTYGRLTDDTEISAEDADAIREAMAGSEDYSEATHSAQTVAEAAARAQEAQDELRRGVQQARDAGIPIARLAEAAGVTRQTIYRWVEEAR